MGDSGGRSGGCRSGPHGARGCSRPTVEARSWAVPSGNARQGCFGWGHLLRSASAPHVRRRRRVGIRAEWVLEHLGIAAGLLQPLRPDRLPVVADMHDAVPMAVACLEAKKEDEANARVVPEPREQLPRGRLRPRLRRPGVLARERPACLPPRVLTVRSRPADPSPVRVRPAGTCDSSRRTPSSACTPASPRRCSCPPPPVTTRPPRDGTRW